MYSVYDVLRAVDYPALSRIVGDELITGLPCPVAQHANQSERYGPAAVYPPKSGDPGTVICHNCGEKWGAQSLAKALAVEKAIRSAAPAPPPKPVLEAKSSPEPIALQGVWQRAQKAAAKESACLEYLARRWGDEDLAKIARRHVGWTADIKGRYFNRNYHLMVPLRGKDGAVATATRRYVGASKVDNKSKRLPNAAVGLASGTPIWFGDNPDEVKSKAAASTLWIGEGEIDTLLLLALREKGLITGAVIGAPGSAANSLGWWEATASLLDKPWPQSVVLVIDNDEAGDSYVQKSASFFPGAKRVFLPEGCDLTDVMANQGLSEVVSTLNAARNAGHRYYVLDDGRYAYYAGEKWYVCKKLAALKARIMESGVPPEDAAAVASMLPPAADLVFDPSSHNRVVFREGNTWLNSWKGLPLVACEGKWDAIHELLWRLCGRNKGVMDYVLDWLAAPLQAIAKGTTMRCKTALIFHGDQGTGKGLFFDGAMRAIYGRYHGIVNHRNLEDKFDPQKIGDSLFLVANEVADSTLRDANTLNILKSWVTDPFISVRKMNRAAFEIPIYFNLVMTSNHGQPIRLEPSDRRYSLVRCDEPLHLDKDFLRQLILERDSEWPTAPHFLNALLTREIAHDVTRPLVTQWREALIEAGRPSQEAFAIAICTDGFNSLAEDWMSEVEKRGRSGPFWLEKAGFVPTLTLSEVYSFWCRQQGVRHPVRSHELVESIKKECESRSIELKQVQKQISRKRLRGLAGLPMFKVDEQKATQQRAEEALTKLDSWPVN